VESAPCRPSFFLESLFYSEAMTPCPGDSRGL